ncbi:MAG: hypothetical protein M1407_03975 [Deltaproteobacteria bacterium]|nr:hypothetical protein [Deltaproteobacteria bacterium]
MNTENIKKFISPALRLWWRYTWRLWLFMIFIGIILLISGEILLGKGRGAIFAKMLKNHLRHFTPYDMKIALIIPTLLLIFFIALFVFGVWLFKASIFKKSFYNKGVESNFSIEHNNNILDLPLTWNIATRLWWGIFWRSFLLNLAARLLFFWTGNFILIIEIFASYLSFLWLLSYNYGKTKIIISRK